MTLAERFHGFDGFSRDRDVVTARAPGRLDVMGGIGDYSGSLVLQKTLAEAAWAAVQKTDEPVLELVSLETEATGQRRELSLPLSAVTVSYHDLRAKLDEPTRHWASYLAGLFAVLASERGVRFSSGARVLIASDVPEGAGVASSAAIEVATMQAVCAAFDLHIAPRELALLCQIAENRVAGAACGVMDQMAAACGEVDSLFALLCQPAEPRDPVVLPDDVEIWGIDSGLRHSVAGSDYTSVRVGTFMGLAILSAHEGKSWGGYLANIEASEFQESLAALLPEQMSGAEFLERYGDTGDPVTTPEPDRIYAVRAPASQPVHGHQRVRAFAELLSQPPAEDNRRALGELMYASHASMSDCGLGSEGTDLLVELVQRAGPQSGLLGAKITGGGCGGAVAVIGLRGADAAVESVAEDYEQLTGRHARLFRGSSPGAHAYGTTRLRPSG